MRAHLRRLIAAKLSGCARGYGWMDGWRTSTSPGLELPYGTSTIRKCTDACRPVSHAVNSHTRVILVVHVGGEGGWGGQRSGVTAAAAQVCTQQASDSKVGRLLTQESWWAGACARPRTRRLPPLRPAHSAPRRPRGAWAACGTATYCARGERAQRAHMCEVHLAAVCRLSSRRDQVTGGGR
eukprot:COSAG01_NODE_11065_length_2016_cov_1.883672_1_plen_182_part_00